MDKLRVGVIGLGMGRHHIAGYQTHPRAEVVAIADPDPARLQEIGDKFNVPKRYAAGEEMLAQEKLDIVSIVTPNKFHRELTLAAFAAGCHVLCEKPMAMNAAEAREMLAASRAAGKRLMINFSWRFTEQSFALKAEVDAGLVGDIYFGRTIWHRRRGLPGFGGWFGQKTLSGGGPLIDLGVHRLDLALWLMGYPRPAWVMGKTYNAIAAELAAQKGAAYDVEDLAAAFITFENNASLVVEASWAANISERELMETRLYGTKAGLVQRNIQEGYTFEAELYLERNGSHYNMTLHGPAKPVPKPMAHFVESIVNDTPHIATCLLYTSDAA
ncbi:MAG: Gfo/Idh/MocA family oxidoreductase, partial [Anaerolineae bacterium]|nr:Gfo/Idh/MocA family oxidoreductase [Anaerolineae bacterium]